MVGIGFRTAIACAWLLGLSALTPSAGAADGVSVRVGTRQLEIKAGTDHLHPSGSLESAELLTDQTVDDLPLSGSPARIQFFESGKLRAGLLSAQARVDGLSLRAGAAFELFESGSLRSGALAEATPVHGVSLPAGTILFKNSKGRLLQAYPPDHARIHGIPVAGDSEQEREIQFYRRGPAMSLTSAEDVRLGRIPIPAGSRVYLQANGDLHTVALSRPVEVGGFRFRREIRLSADGRIEEAWLERAQIIAGVRFHHARAPIVFHGNGRVASGTLDGPQTVQRVSIPAESPVRFHENGQLAQALLAEDQTISGLTFAGSQSGTRAGDGLTWYRSGQLQAGVLAGDQRADGHVFRGRAAAGGATPTTDARLFFHPNGRVRSGLLAHDQVIDGLGLMACTDPAALCRVEFDRRGKLRAGRLAKDWRRGGAVFAAQSRIRLHHNGRVAHGQLAAEHRLGSLRLPRGALIALDGKGRLIHQKNDLPWPIGSLEVPAGSILLRDEHERVRAVHLGRSIDLPGLPAPAETWLLLDRLERIASALVSKPVRIGLVGYPAQTLFFLAPESGWPQRAVLAGDARIQGLPLSADSPIDLHPNGRVRSGRLAAGVVLAGRPIPAGEQVHLYADGSVERGALPADEAIGGVLLMAGDQLVATHANGTPKSVIIDQPRQWDGLTCRGRTPVTFHPNGVLASCWLVDDAERAGLPIRDKVTFHPSGALAMTYLARETEIGGLRFSADQIAFYANGRVARGRLASAQMVGGKIRRSLSLISWGERGQLLRVQNYAPPIGAEP